MASFLFPKTVYAQSEEKKIKLSDVRLNLNFLNHSNFSNFFFSLSCRFMTLKKKKKNSK